MVQNGSLCLHDLRVFVQAIHWLSIPYVLFFLGVVVYVVDHNCSLITQPQKRARRKMLRTQVRQQIKTKRDQSISTLRVQRRCSMLTVSKAHRKTALLAILSTARRTPLDERDLLTLTWTRPIQRRALGGKGLHRS